MKTLNSNAQKPNTRRSISRLAGWIAAGTLAAALIGLQPASAQTWEQPFTTPSNGNPGSIWNTPVNPGASFAPANLGTLGLLQDDVVFLVQGQSTDPTFAIINPKTGDGYNSFPIHIPEGFSPDAPGLTPNNNSAFLDPDGHTVREVAALTRQNQTDPFTGSDATFYGYLFGDGNNYDDDVNGDGVEGGHAGSGLSILGGTIRSGELTSTGGSINHAIKIELDYGQLYQSTDPMDTANRNETYRWPARQSDDAATNSGTDGYYGTNSSLRMGSLLAIPHYDNNNVPVTADSLGITTEPGRRMFAALQTYGAYVVDTYAGYANATAGNGGYICNICFEHGVDQDFANSYPDLGSLPTGSGAWYNDLNLMYGALEVVDSNGPNSIGG